MLEIQFQPPVLKAGAGGGLGVFAPVVELADNLLSAARNVEPERNGNAALRPSRSCADAAVAAAPRPNSSAARLVILLEKVVILIPLCVVEVIFRSLRPLAKEISEFLRQAGLRGNENFEDRFAVPA